MLCYGIEHFASIRFNTSQAYEDLNEEEAQIMVQLIGCSPEGSEILVGCLEFNSILSRSLTTA